MGGPAWPPSRFWQYWALAGMLVLWTVVPLSVALLIFNRRSIV